ncbi:hypothetical protein EYD10_13424, partial [Varanus komodoensis]
LSPLVLEACAVPAQGCGPEDLWRKLLRQGLPEELQAPLHQLAALQGALWLATGRRGSAAGLFQLLSGAKSQGPSPRHGREAELTSLLQAWCPPDVEASDPLLVENGQHLGGALRVSAALLQGVDELDAGRPAAALAHLQVAATGLCSRQALARIFALMGCCSWKAGKPQMALQHLRRALQVDFAFLPALHQAAALYRQLGLVDAELEALALLHQATVDAAHPGFPSPTELLICGPRLAAFFVQKSPVEVKYTMAQRCLQAGRAAEAVEHYLDLLALLQDGPPAQVSPRRESALPRVPEVFLEAASGLQELARHRDAIAVCEEVVARASELVPERLQVELGCSARAMAGSLRAQAAGVPARQTRESLCCVLWRAAAYLAQGWAWAGLGDPKEAVGLLSRCLNDLLRICFVSTGSSPEEEMERTAIPEAKVLSQIRQLALTGRGAQFLQLERDKEALMDFQHSLCICPDGPTANLYLIHTLWKLGRRQEAAARWQRFCSSPSAPEVPKAERSFPLYLLTIITDGDCSQEIKRRLLLGRKAMANLDSILKSRDITLWTKVRIVKTMVFPGAMYGCESWTIRKAERRRIEAFEVWCWRRLLRVPWTARQSNRSVLEEINPGCSSEGHTLEMKLKYFGHLMRRKDSLEKSLMLGTIDGR